MPQVEKDTLKNVRISELIQYKRNPRKNDPAIEPVARSLKEFGYVKTSVVVDEDMELLAGHTTLKAMTSLGWDLCPEVTQYTGLTPAQKKAYRIADNKTGDIASWDVELLLGEFQALEDEGYDTTYTAFTDAEIEKLINGDEGEPIPPAAAPEEFPGFDEGIETEYCCPKCGYEWSGKPK